MRPRHRDLVRRDGGRDRRGDAATRARPWRCARTSSPRRSTIHREWGGVVPELSARQHVRDICGVVERALEDAGVGWRATYDAIAVTQGPGLVGSLLVGAVVRQVARLGARRAARAVHHLAGHIESLVLENGEMPLPAVVLVVSGGHTSLYRVPAPRRLRAARPHARRCGGRGVRQGGQAARPRLSGRPGRSIAWPREGNDRAVALPEDAPHARRPQRAAICPGQPRLQLQRPQDRGAAARHAAPRGARAAGADAPLPPREVRDICASFQRVVVETLLDRAVRRGARDSARAASASPAACRPTAGCGATRWRAARRAGLPVFVPGLALSTDNAAMIAAAGLRAFRARRARRWDVNADASLPLMQA